MERLALEYNKAESGDSYAGVRDLLTVLFKHQKTIIVVFIGVTLLAVAISFLMTPIYESQTSLLVKIGREHLSRSEVGDIDERPQASLMSESIIPSEIAILQSKDLIQRVIEKIGVETLYPDLVENPPSNMTPQEAALIIFDENLKVYSVKDSNVIEALYQHESPQIAANVLTNLLELLKEKHLQIYSNPKASFMEEQLGGYKNRLAEAEGKFLRFKQRHGISAIGQQRGLLLEQRKDLDVALKTIDGERKSLQSQVASLTHQLKRVPEMVSLSSVSADRHRIIDEAKNRLLGLQLEEQELLVKYRETSRLVIKVRKDIEVVTDFVKKQESQLADKVTTGKNPIYEGLESQLIQAEAALKGAEAERNVILHQVKSMDSEIQRIDINEPEMQVLEREVSIHKHNYKMYQEKFEEARVSEEMDRLKMANISVIQPATISAKPIKPKKLLYILIGMVVGCLGGVSLAFVSEFMQRGYTRPEQAGEDLRLPVLVSISHKS